MSALKDTLWITEIITICSVRKQDVFNFEPLQKVDFEMPHSNEKEPRTDRVIEKVSVCTPLTYQTVTHKRTALKNLNLHLEIVWNSFFFFHFQRAEEIHYSDHSVLSWVITRCVITNLTIVRSFRGIHYLVTERGQDVLVVPFNKKLQIQRNTKK